MGHFKAAGLGLLVAVVLLSSTSSRIQYVDALSPQVRILEEVAYAAEQGMECAHICT